MDNKEKFYITYGFGSNLANCFSVVEGENYGVARKEVDTVTSGKFAFMYDEKEFAGQQERYRLTEVPLQAQAVIPDGHTADELERDNPYNQWMYEK